MRRYKVVGEGNCLKEDSYGHWVMWKDYYELREELAHCKKLLDHCTYHDGRYEQCASRDYQNDCIDTSKRIDGLLQGGE